LTEGDETVLKQAAPILGKHEIVSKRAPDTNVGMNIGNSSMQHGNNQAGLDFAEVWRAPQHRRTDDIATSDVDILKTISAFCGGGLLISLFLAILGLDIVGLL
jgi:hypothetical protein